MTLDRAAPLLFAFLWSTGWISAKYGAGVADPFTFLCVRYAAATAVFVALCLALRVPFPNDRAAAVRAMISGALLHGFYLAAIWWAISQGLPAGLSAIIAALQPLLTAILAMSLIGERLSGFQKLGLGMGFAGVAAAVLPKLVGQDFSKIAGTLVLINVLGMISVTCGTIFQKRYLAIGDLRSIAMLQFAGAFLVTLPFAVAFEPMQVDLTWGFAAVLSWSVFGNSMAAVLLLLYLLRRGQASRAASLIYLVPPMAAVQALILFDEWPTPLMIAGMVVAVAGVYLVNRKVPPAPDAHSQLARTK